MKRMLMILGIILIPFLSFSQMSDLDLRLDQSNNPDKYAKQMIEVVKDRNFYLDRANAKLTASVIVGVVSIIGISSASYDDKDINNYRVRLVSGSILGLISSGLFISSMFDYSIANTYKFNPYYSKENGNNIYGLTIAVKL